MINVAFIITDEMIFVFKFFVSLVAFATGCVMIGAIIWDRIGNKVDNQMVAIIGLYGLITLLAGVCIWV